MDGKSPDPLGTRVRALLRRVLFPALPKLEQLSDQDARRAEAHTRELQALDRRLRATGASIERSLTALHTQLDTIERKSARLGQRIHEMERRLPGMPVRGTRESLDLSGIAELIAAQTSAAYMIRNMSGARRFQNHEALLRECVVEAGHPPLILEFGVFSGKTINILADASLPDCRLYGFDSFEGLPETWRPGFDQGAFAVQDLPPVDEKVTLVKGWFTDTLPRFVDRLTDPVPFVHIDCDLYSSTKFVLEQLHSKLAAETVLIFDEYFNYPGWEEHEFKAFHEFLAEHSFAYDYIGLVPSHQQVAVRLRRV